LGGAEVREKGGGAKESQSGGKNGGSGASERGGCKECLFGIEDWKDRGEKGQERGDGGRDCTKSGEKGKLMQ